MNIVFKQHVVAYLDILGFSEFIEQAENNKSGELKNLEKLLFSIIPKKIQLDGFESRFPDELEIKCLSSSDSIIISAPVDTNISHYYPSLFSISIKAIQIAHALLEIGFLVRGALSVGNAYRSESNIVGTGYQDAVNGEKCAVYPKILLTDSAKRHLCKLLDKKMTRLAIFSKDEDEKVILNSIYPSAYYVDDQSGPSEKYYSTYREHILKNINNPCHNHKIKKKWLWFAKLFDSNVNYFTELKGIKPIGISGIVPNFLNPQEKESIWLDSFKAPGYEGRIIVPEKMKSEE